MQTAIAISLGAIPGALCRYYLTLGMTRWLSSDFPYGTFLINLTGCLLMGFFVTFATERLPTLAPDLKLFVTTGFLGAYTTFSTYGLDTANLLNTGNVAIASFYWAGSAVSGILCLQLGVTLAQHLPR